MTKLKEIREDLRVSQEVVARRTRKVTLRTYANAENGKAVKYSTAVDILNAINSVLREYGKPAVALDDLELNLE